MAMKRGNLPAIVPELFEHEQFGQFRYIKHGEEIWFVANDLCRALGYSNPRDALSKHVYKEDKRVILMSQIATLDTTLEIPNRGLTFINESGMYCLIFGSKLPAAKKFTRWVTHEVLPSIRKYGFYGLLNGEKALQLTDKEYLRYLGELDYFQYQAYLDQLTGEQRSEHYSRLEERIDRKDLTQEEILSLGNDPYIIVSRIGHGPWKASY